MRLNLPSFVSGLKIREYIFLKLCDRRDYFLSGSLSKVGECIIVIRLDLTIKLSPNTRKDTRYCVFVLVQTKT